METASKKKPVKQPSKTKPTKAEKPVYTFDDTKNNTSSKAAKEAIRELRDAEMRRKMGERYDEIVGKPEMAKGGAVQKKMSKVMGEYKAGTLRSGGTGKAVKNPKQAVAVAMSEARRLKK